MKVECRYANKCTDYGRKCYKCKHNEIRSYFEPVEGEE